MQGFLSTVAVVTVAIVLFLIYFFFKMLGFFINATRLYRRMINRQDAMLRLLLDIRDNTKTADLRGLEAIGSNDAAPMAGKVSSDDEQAFCYHCGESISATAGTCPACKKSLV